MNVLRRVWQAVLVFVAFFLSTAAVAYASDAVSQPSDPLVELGISVTSGAAAGYVADAVCAECHVDKAESFAEMGMSKSFFRPSPDKVIEDFFDNRFHHKPSDRHYEMELRDGEYWFRRYRLARDGRRIDVFERKIDWILGSGHHTRTYLYQTDDGALFQLPVAWYSQDGKWEMAPGFEWKRHLGVMRVVRRQCMFCHNAYPDVADDSDQFGIEDLFPHDLPEGIGCQRCHGPGADHLRTLHGENSKVEDIRASIVNPANLDNEVLYSICFGCHMQPSVAVPAVRRFGRDAYSFRPGQSLSDFRVELDIKDRSISQSDRFEINHHPYRLEQSRCFVESEGKLGCLTCHDPHKKIKPSERAAHYRKACLSCHGDGRGGLALGGDAQDKHPTLRGDDDCTLCHMPERRTQDVIHVTMTDHLIVREPGGLELLAPIEKRDADIEEVFARLDGFAMSEIDETIYKTVGVLRYTRGRYQPAAESLEALLRNHGYDAYEPWMELAESHLKRRNYAAALDIVREAKSRAPDHPKIAEIEANALYSIGKKQEAISLVEAGLRPDAEQLYRLGVMKLGVGDKGAALALARRALELRDNLWVAWRMIGEIRVQQNQHDLAANAFARALAIEPDDDRNREGMINSLTALGRQDEAEDYR